MGRVARGILILGVAACARQAPALAPPSGPLPWFAARLGEPCAADLDWDGGFELCELGKISYVVRNNAHYLVTGVLPGGGCCQWGVPCRDPGAGPSVESSPSLDFPRRRLVTRTLCRHGRDVDEQSVYVDGAHIWIVGVSEVSFTVCREGVVVLADRRLLSARGRETLRALLSLAPGVDLDDDAALERALRELPSLPPGAGGCLSSTRAAGPAATG
ncbi:MAG TPA: hypothetical protein PLU22_05140 [Polyangiaceae bacterium]|nr:hypothetical protein [Polyangiaceae bacterium]